MSIVFLLTFEYGYMYKLESKFVNRNICSEFVAVTWQRCRGNMHGACVAAQGWVGCVRLSVWLQVGSLLLAIVALQCSASAWGAEQSVSIVKR